MHSNMHLISFNARRYASAVSAMAVYLYVRLSVCLSFTSRNSIKTATYDEANTQHDGAVTLLSKRKS